MTEKFKRVKETRRPLSTAAAARQLGVSREHLSRVLHGHRISRSLLNRYNLIKEQFKPSSL